MWPVKRSRTYLRRLVNGATLAVLLVGCAPHNTFVQPDDPTAAKLRVVMSDAAMYGIVLSEVDSTTCRFHSQVGWLSGGAEKDPIRVGMYDGAPAPQDGILERRVPVGKKFALAPSFLVVQASFGDILFSTGVLRDVIARDLAAREPSECRFPVFVPEQGAQYEMNIEMSPGKCNVALQQLVYSPASPVVRKPAEPGGTILYSHGLLRCPPSSNTSGTQL